MAARRLFTPIKIGDITLQHRVALAPLTRFRSTKKEHVPLDIVATYYEQRASTPGTLLITEATFIAPQAGGYDYVPGIWSNEQIAAWKKVLASLFCGILESCDSSHLPLQVTDAVHAKGSFIFLQLWALGRAAVPSILAEGGYPYISASDAFRVM